MIIELLFVLSLYFIVRNYFDDGVEVQHNSDDTILEKDSGLYAIKTVSLKNVSKVVTNRIDQIEKSFKDAYSMTGWKVLRTSINTSIEFLDTEDGFPGYLMTSTYVHEKPSYIFDLFKWENFDKTQRAIDPFYENANIIASVGNTKIIRKTSKKPLIFPQVFFLRYSL